MDSQHYLVAGAEGGHRVRLAGNGHGWAHLGQYSTILLFIGNTLIFNYFGFLNCYPKKQKLLLFLISRMMAVI